MAKEPGGYGNLIEGLAHIQKTMEYALSLEHAECRKCEGFTFFVCYEEDGYKVICAACGFEDFDPPFEPGKEIEE